MRWWHGDGSTDKFSDQPQPFVKIYPCCWLNLLHRWLMADQEPSTQHLGRSHPSNCQLPPWKNHSDAFRSSASRCTTLTSLYQAPGTKIYHDNRWSFLQEYQIVSTSFVQPEVNPTAVTCHCLWTALWGLNILYGSALNYAPCRCFKLHFCSATNWLHLVCGESSFLAF